MCIGVVLDHSHGQPQHVALLALVHLKHLALWHAATDHQRVTPVLEEVGVVPAGPVHKGSDRLVEGELRYVSRS